MSDADDGNKTVFRPSPLAGRKGGGPLMPTPAGNPWPGQGGAPTPTAATPATAQAPAAGGDLSAMAQTVLSLATALRDGRTDVPLARIHGQAAQAMEQFDAAIRSRYPEELRRQAVYAVGATIDDVAQHSPGAGDDAAEWSRRSMVAQFSGAGAGDDRFWSLIDEATRAPVNAELIRLLQACLAAGYQGHFRRAPDAGRQIDQAGARLEAALAPPAASPPPPPPHRPASAPAPQAAPRPAAAPQAAKPRASTAPVGKRTGRTLAIVLILIVVLLAVGYVAAKRLLPPGTSIGPVHLSHAEQGAAAAALPRRLAG